MSNALPLPGFPAPTSIATPLVDVARTFASGLDELDAADRVLVVMIEQLATSIDTAARTGKASAAAMAARELREAVAYLQTRRDLDDAADPEQSFAEFRALLLDSVTATGCARCASCDHGGSS